MLYSSVPFPVMPRPWEGPDELKLMIYGGFPSGSTWPERLPARTSPAFGAVLGAGPRLVLVSSGVGVAEWGGRGASETGDAPLMKLCSGRKRKKASKRWHLNLTLDVKSAGRQGSVGEC